MFLWKLPCSKSQNLDCSAPKTVQSKLNETMDKNIKLASDYDDPTWVEINVLLPEILQAYKEQYEEMRKEGYKSPFIDFLKDEIKIKRKKFANGSSFMDNYLQQSQFINQPKKAPEARGLANLTYMAPLT